MGRTKKSITVSLDKNVVKAIDDMLKDSLGRRARAPVVEKLLREALEARGVKIK